MPDIKFQYRKQEFSNKTSKSIQKSSTKSSDFEIGHFKINNNCLNEPFNDSSNQPNLISDFSSSQISPTMFNSLTDFNSTTIEIDSKDHFDLQKDNHLIQFNRLECIFDFCNPRNTISVKLKKGLRGLGISLGGGRQVDEQTNEMNHENNQNFSLINQLIRVKKLYQAHPASECGLIDENDFILDVNDHCFVGLTYIEAFNILHSVQDEVTLRIFKFNQCPLELQKYLLPKDDNLSFENSFSEFREANIFESTRITELDDEEQTNQSIEQSRYQIRKVILIKKDGSLGFTLSKIENEGFYVKQVLKEPACLEQINPGDRIISVNGTSLDGLDLNDAIKLLRSLPDLCEFKLEQICESSNNLEYNTDNSLNYQSETEEDDNRFKKKQLRHEVKIMLDSRNKDPLNNRLKRKDLKKSTKEESTKEQKNERKNLESNLEISKFVDSGLDSGLNDSKLFEDNKSSFLDNLIDSNLESKLDKENYNAFTKVNKQPINDSSFFRQSSVIDFSRNEAKNQQSEKFGKQNNNLNKWRNAILSGVDKEDEDAFDLNLNSTFKQTHFFFKKELNDDDSDFGDELTMNRSRKQTDNQTDNRTVNRTVNNQIDKNHFQCKQDLIRLSDIQLNLNNDCLLSENSMYKNIENALFFYITLDRIGWCGRLGFSLIDDQINDFRVVNTSKHGFSACVVKEIYPNSLAYSDGRIKVGDKLLEVNNQQLINKPVQTVIKDLRKLKGKLRLLLIRKVF